MYIIGIYNIQKVGRFKMKKILIIGLVLVLTIGLIGGCSFFSDDEEEKTNEEERVWDTYSDDDFGIKYPEDWTQYNDYDYDSEARIYVFANINNSSGINISADNINIKTNIDIKNDIYKTNVDIDEDECSFGIVKFDKSSQSLTEDDLYSLAKEMKKMKMK